MNTCMLMILQLIQSMNTLLNSTNMQKSQVTVKCLLNIILDPIFISGLGMGARGAAIATVIGYIASDIYCTVVLLKKSQVLSMNLRCFRISGEYEKQIRYR